MTDPLAPHRVVAFNIAATSENKIHDDAVAARFGFAGGLVPGVAVYGYMAHAPVALWGRDWLERGSAECRFADPVYEGQVAVARGTLDQGSLLLEVSDAAGRRQASGRASLPPAAELPPAPAADALALRPPAAGERPVADERSLQRGARLAIEPFACDDGDAYRWLLELRETEPLYRRERLLHPATLLRVANAVLTQNVVLGPWIHVGSRVRHHAALPRGAEIGAVGVVTSNHEHKGHRFVELAIEVWLDRRTPAATIEHTAIYLPRQVAAAGR